jgi:hypothetical protein
MGKSNKKEENKFFNTMLKQMYVFMQKEINLNTGLSFLQTLTQNGL